MLSRPLRLLLALEMAAALSLLAGGCSSGTPLFFGADMLLQATPDVASADLNVGTGGGEGQIGDPCTGSSDCSTGLTCLLGEAYPGGLCALPCPSGTCPPLSRCVPTQ